MDRSAFWRWTAIGGIVASLLIVTQARAVGGVEGMLQVGEASALRPLIEAQLGEIPLAPGPGHDGQIYYAIGLDLDGDQVAPLLDHGAYRYRRILYPLVSSGFGFLGGTALLYGLILVAGVSMALATGITAGLTVANGQSEWLALAVLLNPGVWLSVRLLTADASAVALMLIALLWYESGKTRSVTSFTLSALTKDVFLATPVPLGLSRHRAHWPTFLIPTAVLSMWMVWLSLTLGDGFAARGNLTWPLKGIAEASANWSGFTVEEWLYLAFALLSVVGGVAYSIRRSWLRWAIASWTALAVISSNWVWDFGNNAARAYAPIVILIVLSNPQVAATASVVGASAMERDE